MVRVRAPELPSTAPWWNCAQPLSLKALRGRVVILDFWTYGCINCLHTVPDLSRLHQTFGAELVIIGVHTPKFDHEGEAEAVEQAIRRFGITHPVLLDADRSVWDQYAVRAWPTFVVIDPQGYVVATLSGEGQQPALAQWVQRLIPDSLKEAGPEAKPHPPLPVTSHPTPAQRLAFPGKVLADATTDSLYIADTGHHRVVVTTLEGQPKAVFGSGIAGWQDGSATTAQFTAPQGLALDSPRQRLYIADTGNHLIRQIDLRQQQVSTLAGTGSQSRLIFPHGGWARDVALNSPWDLALIRDTLYIAMAGSHQIWQMDLPHHRVQTLLGTGAEFCVDGDATVAAFAQPSGLATDGTSLWVADSETSSIRAITLAPTPTVTTLCGSGQLFDFGDQDGIGDNARLQHCLGIAYGQGALWIADTYNHKIKRVDPATGLCQTFVGRGKDTAPLAEPSGLTSADGALYIADTNHHAIQRIDLASGLTQPLID